MRRWEVDSWATLACRQLHWAIVTISKPSGGPLVGKCVSRPQGSHAGACMKASLPSVQCHTRLPQSQVPALLPNSETVDFSFAMRPSSSSISRSCSSIDRCTSGRPSTTACIFWIRILVELASVGRFLASNGGGAFGPRAAISAATDAPGAAEEGMVRGTPLLPLFSLSATNGCCWCWV
jgi:hypothetical protein